MLQANSLHRSTHIRGDGNKLHFKGSVLCYNPPLTLSPSPSHPLPFPPWTLLLSPSLYFLYSPLPSPFILSPPYTSPPLYCRMYCSTQTHQQREMRAKMNATSRVTLEVCATHWFSVKSFTSIWSISLSLFLTFLHLDSAQETKQQEGNERLGGH